GAPGVITARQVEAGQVVQAAQTVFTIAEDGDRDAVFNVHETLVARTPSGPAVTITLLSDPQIRAVGKVREISPAGVLGMPTFTLIDPEAGSTAG
ncbi:HlyD family efflux transporter periplasmic adaptor subunit, partial [Mesorhizobium sp. M2E.F.Ca.ET.166.01.1.1]|uniref:HlyD family efflux transporter periplasmic adaptor subunit n=1 Tax=Mesorhizobium sp. M2E.F.Ca.ET.166.01.1.1 TaxID=2500523 RepID=UPI001FEFDAD2